jgi:hypothetical protein
MNLKILTEHAHPTRDDEGNILQIELPMAYGDKHTTVWFQFHQNPLPADSDVRATALEAILELGREISGS